MRRRRQNVYSFKIPSRDRGLLARKRQAKARAKALAITRSGTSSAYSIPRNNFRTGGWIGTEYKFFDTAKATATLTSTWTGGELDPAVFNCLFAPVKGTGPSDRNGDKAHVVSISVRGKIAMPVSSDQADVLTPRSFCILLVLDTQTNGAQLNAEDVMVATEPEELNFRNLQYRQRFRVLKKWKGTLHQTVAFNDGANTGSVTGGARLFECNLKMGNMPVTFIGNGGTIADIGDNSLHIIGCSNSATPTITYACRVRFVG